MKTYPLLLKNKGTKKQRYWQVTAEDKKIIVSYGTKVDKPTVKEIVFDTPQKANIEADKRYNKKLATGYACFGKIEDSVKGAVRLLTVVPDNSASNFIDISPDNTTLAVATIKRDARGAVIYLVDIATNVWTTLYEEKSTTYGGRQTFIHSLHFNKIGTEIFYTLNEETKVINIGTKEVKIIAQFMSSSMNVFCMRPSMDIKKERYLYFDINTTLKVRDSRGAVIFEQAHLGNKTTHPRYACISPSGKYLALYRASRHIIYGHTNAAHDKTNEVQIWDIDKQTLQHTMLVKDNECLHSLGFTPDEQHIVTTIKYAQGPVIYQLATGKQIYAQQHYRRTDRLDICFNWTFSPDGQLFIVGGFGITIKDIQTKEEVFKLADGSYQRAYGLICSQDGQYLVAGGDRGYLIVYQLKK